MTEEIDTQPALPDAGVQKVVASLPVDHFGTTVYVKGWCPPERTRPPVVIVHDLGEHVGLYRSTAKDLVPTGYSVYGFDLRGHGRSGRRLGHAPSFRILVNDLLQVVAWVRHREAGHQPIVIGHGIGALIALEFARRHSHLCKGLVLSAPCLELSAKVRRPTRLMLKMMSELLPTSRLPKAIHPRFARDLRLNRDGSREGRTYFPRLTANFAAELLHAIEKAGNHFITYRGDMLVLCPEEDAVCTYKALRKAVAIHSESNIRVVDIPGAGHDLFTDGPELRSRVLAEVQIFLEYIASVPPSAVSPAPLVADEEQDPPELHV